MRHTRDLQAILHDIRNIDVQSLFNQYDSVYFDDKLKGMQVRWSNKMTLCAGQFQWGKKSLKHGSEIVLSEPLLKMRPKSDTINTLLHEMIHAYMHVTQQRDTSDHGTIFQFWMRLINESEMSQITIFHTFHDEVDHYRQHVWACDKCGNIIKRAMNRDPNFPCGPRDEGYFVHRQICDGGYVKIHAPEKSLLQKKSKEKKNANQKTLDRFFEKSEESLSTECPICGKSMAKDMISALHAHVNACLDGKQLDGTIKDNTVTEKKRKIASQVINLIDEENESVVTEENVRKRSKLILKKFS